MMIDHEQGKSDGPETPPPPLSTTPGVIFALHMDGHGRGVEFGHSGRIEDIKEAWNNADPQRPVWLHIDRNHPQARQWLTEDSGLSAAEVEALLQVEPRPRLVQRKDSVLMILRGINLNTDATEDPVLALRLLAMPHRLVTVRVWRVMSVRDVRASLLEGDGPTSIAEAITEVIVGIAERIADQIDTLETAADEVETSLDDRDKPSAVRARIADLRREAIRLRRYLSPQAEAVASLARNAPPWIDEPCRQRLAEVSERLRRDLDTLDQARDHLSIAHDELTNTLSERMNRTTYLLTIVAALFLPLGFVTGLLGINVGGIPLAENHSGFWVVLVICLMISTSMGVGLAWLLRRL